MLTNPHQSQGHTVVDLGGDAFTVGRLHPMLDNELRIRRLLQEARDAETGMILLDVVLGDGAHADPASELAPAIGEAIKVAAKDGRRLTVVAVVIGTDADPQGLDRQIKQLKAVGAIVFTCHDEAVRAVAGSFGGETDDRQHRIAPLSQAKEERDGAATADPPVTASFAAINVGLESFSDSLRVQGAAVVHVDWRPPAGGDEKLAGLLTRLKGR